MARARCAPRPLGVALTAVLMFAAATAGLADAGPVTASPVDEFWSTEVAEVAEDDDVQFHLYTRAHPRTFQRLETGDSDYDPRRATVLMAHGFLGSGTTESVTMVRDAVLGAADVQFVAVDWERLADGDYLNAAANTTVVAARVAALLDALVAGLGADLADFHLVGFSLGAQVMAQVGRTLKAGPVPRITAMDPARPLFDAQPPAGRLDAGDAQLVVVLHTAGGVAAFAEPLGHVDFFPNGGVSPQPACAHANFPLVCSHMMAPTYLSEAVARPGSLVGVRCPSWEDFLAGGCEGHDSATLGLFHNYTTLGSFYLRTADLAPYGLSDVGARPPRPALELDNSLDGLEEGRAGQRREGRMRHLEGGGGSGGAGAASAAASGALLLLSAAVALAAS